MTQVTPGFPTSLAPETIDAWSTRLNQAFAARAVACAVPAGVYPVVTAAAGSACGPITLQVERRTTATLTRHASSSAPMAPAMTLAFSTPVRLAVNVLPAWSSTPGARWVCGEYGLAVSRVELDRNGRVTLHAETGRLLSWPVAWGETLWKWQHRVRQAGTPTINAETSRLFGKPMAWSEALWKWHDRVQQSDTPVVDAEFFAALVRPLMAHLEPAAAGTANTPVRNVTVSAKIRSPEDFFVRASGDLRGVAAQHPAGRALLNSFVCRALMPPNSGFASDPGDAAVPGEMVHRWQASAHYRDGLADVKISAAPDAPSAPRWNGRFIFAAPGRPERRLLSAVAVASQPQQNGAPPAPLTALVHGFSQGRALPTPVAPATVPAPAPAVVVPARELPKSIETPLLDLLNGVRVQADAHLRAGSYSTGAWAPGSRLIAPVDGNFAFDVKTTPRTDKGPVRLQSAALRWTGAGPLIWRIGFTDFVLGRAVGRLLDRLFHVRIHGIKAQDDGDIRVDGDLYLLGWRLCRIDTLRHWAARRWPDLYPVMRAETEVSKWLRGIYVWPNVPRTNDQFWESWQDMCAMNLHIRWRLRPLDGATLQTALFDDGRLTTDALTGDVRMSRAGDLTLRVAGAARLPEARFSYDGAHHIAGSFSARFTKHMFPRGQGVPWFEHTPDETGIAADVNLHLSAPFPVDGRVGVRWAAAAPNAMTVRFNGNAAPPDFPVPLRGELGVQVDFAQTPPAGSPLPFVLSRATWRLDNDVPLMPGFTVAAGRGGYFTQITPAQHLALVSMRAAQLAA